MDVMSEECSMEDSLMVGLKLYLYVVEVLEHLESGTFRLIPIIKAISLTLSVITLPSTIKLLLISRLIEAIFIING